MALQIFKHIFRDIGIDLGTANSIIYVNDRGFVLNQPSVIAYNHNKIFAIGDEAKKMMGKAHPHIRVVRPLADGVISDFKAGEDMIKSYMQQAGIPRFLINKAVIGVPTGITSVEKRAVVDSALAAGARKAFLIAEPMAAAIGLGLDVLGDHTHMIVDIGGGTTDIAIISYGGIVLDNTLRIAGDEMNEALISYFKNQHQLHVGLLTAEKIKIDFGTIDPEVEEDYFPVRGIDHQSRLPRELLISNTVFEVALQSVMNSIVETIHQTLDELPPELASDLIDYGIVLTGGGALLRGIDQYLRNRIKIPVNYPDNALFCVAEGTRRILQDMKKYKPLLSN